MKNLFIFSLFMALLFSHETHAQCRIETSILTPLFVDEFDNGLDPEKWRPSDWCFEAGHLKFEPSNVTVSDGSLKLGVKKVDDNGCPGDHPPYRWKAGEVASRCPGCYGVNKHLYNPSTNIAIS